MLLFSLYTKAQQVKQTETISRSWIGYFNQTRFSNKWGIWAEAQLRTKEDFVEGLSQGLVRAGLTYYISDAAKLTAGYAYVNDFPASGHRNISVPEHRPWQQLQWHTKYGHKRMMQWFRLEQRFKRRVKNDDELSEDYVFTWRARYNFWYDIPLSKKGIVANSWSVILNDEVHINFGKNIVHNYFDQNRLFVGFKYQFTENTNLQFGYMYLFQQLSVPNSYRNTNTVRAYFFQNIDARRK
ncbi:MAG TPA: DUF2490 domain-containing protein [Ferruginibacter sp.]|nr:DUF2490 domain-containing protein [Ferruginibacter sp.]HMP21460.1 DUF2490 domain-containing protein [Ferruginibacter sp.]